MQGLCLSRLIRTLLSLLFIILPGLTRLAACPVLLYVQPDLPGLKGPRDQLRLFTWSQSRQQWLRLPVQTDPLLKGGGLKFTREPHWESAELSPHDRLVLDPGSFESPVAREPLPCRGAVSFLIRDYNRPGKGAVLTSCSSDGLKTEKAEAIVFQPEKKRLYSASYSYRFDPENAMLFRSVFLTASVRRFLTVFHSDLDIYSEVPGFFDLYFGGDRIESEITATHQAPLSLDANVSFFVKVLFLRLRLSLSTDVSFYRSSAHIPMVLYLPVNPKEYLAGRSGILYSWARADKVSMKTDQLHMPVYEQNFSMPSLSEGSSGKNHEIPPSVRSYCQRKGWCDFSLSMHSAGRPLTMQFSLPLSLVQKGFFPVYVRQVSSVYQSLAWNAEPRYAREGREGIFFATAGLDEGSNSWDFWLKLGGPASGRGGLCPYPVTVSQHTSSTETPLSPPR